MNELVLIANFYLLFRQAFLHSRKTQPTIDRPVSSENFRKSFILKAAAAFVAVLVLPKLLSRRRASSSEPTRVAAAFNLRQDPKAISRENSPSA